MPGEIFSLRIRRPGVNRGLLLLGGCGGGANDGFSFSSVNQFSGRRFTVAGGGRRELSGRRRWAEIAAAVDVVVAVRGKHK